MIELVSTKGNKPHKGDYTVNVSGVSFIVHYERVANKIEWILTSSSGQQVSEVFYSKNEIVDYLESMEKVAEKIVKRVFYDWIATAPLGNKVKIRVELDDNGHGKTIAIVYTTAQNPDNNVMATNWILSEVKSYFTGNQDFKPAMFSIRWGKY
jgi:hypothetical protein